MFSRPDFHDAVSDITALLAERAPAPAGSDDETSARMRQIRQAIIARPREPDRRRSWWPRRPQRRRRRTVFTCVAVPVLLAATAAGWAIAVSPPASFVPDQVMCYSGKYMTGIDHSGAFAATVSHGTSPTTLCAHMWATGAVMGDPRDHFVPPLTACVLPGLIHPGSAGDSGSVGVFPDTTCAQLGLAPLPPGYDRAARRLFALDNYLNAGARRCLSLIAADSFARQALRAFGYQGWQVTHPWGTHPKGLAPGGCWEGQPDSPVHAIQVLPEPVLAPADRGLQSVITKTLRVPAGACRGGSQPENGTATAALLQAALRRAHYGTWKVTLLGQASRSLPCYQPMGFTPGSHSIQLTPAIFTGTGY
jgi:hypothetical protein